MNTIVLDGPDGSGKTSLAQKLVNGHGYHKLHFGVPSAADLSSELSMFHFYFDALYKANRERDRVVADRSHLSEPIYGPVMRGGTKLTYRVEALVERYLEAIDAQVVICLPPYRISFNNWVRRKGEEYVKHVDDFKRIYAGYERLLFNRKRNRNFIWYDYTRHDAVGFVSALTSITGHPLPYGVVGSQRPRFLFVGERPGNSNDDTHNFAFLTPEGSSGWLFDRIQEAGYQEHEVAFTNAFFRDGGNVELTLLYDKLLLRGLQQVVALGKIADKALTAAQIPHVAVEHPQFSKRFKSHNLNKYVYALEEIRRRTK